MTHKAEEILSYLDYTTLGIGDCKHTMQKFLSPALKLLTKGYRIAGVCTYPAQASFVQSYISTFETKSVVVACGFPDGQMLFSTKLSEVKDLLELGVDEVDIVLNHDLFKMKRYGELIQEIRTIKDELKGKTLKVIIESSLLDNEEVIKASEIVIEAGADFIKTSTGKNAGGATIEKFDLICEVVQKHFKNTGQKIGVKASGGIKTMEDAWRYRASVNRILGSDYLDEKYFRIGASSLLNDIISNLGSK